MAFPVFTHMLVMFIVFCYFPMWYPASGVVLDCIVSWSLSSFLLVWKFSFLWEMKMKRTGSLSYGKCKVLKL